MSFGAIMQEGRQDVDASAVLQVMLDLMDAVVKGHKGGLVLAVAELEIATKENMMEFTTAHRLIREQMEALKQEPPTKESHNG